MNSEPMYLRYENYEEFYSACKKNNLVVDGVIVTSNHNYCLDLVGDLYKATGKILIDSDGNEYPEKLKEDGYYVNLKFKESIGLEDNAIDVNTPHVIFSGDK